MTQPTEAVGGEAPVPAETAVDPFDALAGEMLGEDEQEEEEQPVEGTEGDEPEVSEAEDEPEIEADDLPPIDAPISWDAEAKEVFKNLPREAQEIVQKRETERERFVQAKAQEVVREKQTLQAEALQFAEQIKAEAVERLLKYAQQFEVSPPDARLYASDPAAYAQQLEAYQYSQAQREQAQRDAQRLEQERAQHEHAIQQHEAEAFRQRLEAELPEFFDAAKGPQLKEELTATAKALGYSDEAIHAANAEEIIALKAVSEWKAQADKYQKLMARQMERVRAGKNPPPIAKPGTQRGPEQNRKARADNAWQAAKSAKTRNAREAALADWAESTGLLD